MKTGLSLSMMALRVSLVCALLWGAVLNGLAHGQPVAQDRIVICTGAATSVIWVDGEGNRVAQTPSCPDCTLGLTGVVPTPALLALPIAVVVPAHLGCRTDPLVVDVTVRIARARGPPRGTADL